jgi:hypothetical protein
MVDFFMIFMWSTFFLVVIALVGFLYATLFKPETENITSTSQKTTVRKSKRQDKKKKTKKS